MRIANENVALHKHVFDLNVSNIHMWQPAHHQKSAKIHAYSDLPKAVFIGKANKTRHELHNFQPRRVYTSER